MKLSSIVVDKRCREEIESIEMLDPCTTNALLAAMGWADWWVEDQIIQEELRALQQHPPTKRT